MTKSITATEFCERTKVLGLRLQPSSDLEIRAVTHLNVTSKNIKKAAEIILTVAESL